MTRVHNENTLKTGKAVPQGAANLACYAIRKPNVSENVQIASMVEKSAQQYLTIPVGSGNVLANSITSRLIMLTDKIDDEGKPLYYLYTLQFNIRSSTPDKKISIISDKGYVPADYKIKQELVYVKDDIYTVNFFTNFWADKVASFYAIYNAVKEDGTIDVGRKELINPQPYMRETKDTPTKNTFKINPNETGVYYVEVGGDSHTYYLSLLDGGNIIAKEAININDKWYPRIVNGRMTKSNPDTKIPEKMVYTVPDYYNQLFSEYGAPYIKITEQASIVSKSAIKVKNFPIYAPLTSDGKVSNITVIINGSPISVLSIDSNSGTIYVSAVVNPNDNIQVTYYYMEDAFIYRGYYDEDTGINVPLDINPSSGHTFGYMDENKNLVIEPSFRLLNKTVYIYAKPSLIQVNSINVNDEQADIASNIGTGVATKVNLRYVARKNAMMNIRTKYSGREIPREQNAIVRCSWDYPPNSDEGMDSIILYNANLLCGEPILMDYLKTDDNYVILKEITSNTLFHTVNKLSISEEDELRAILIAKIYIRPNSSRDTVKLIDTRTRGGGFIEIDDKLRLMANPETAYYLDIGHIQGEPIQENGVIIVRISKYILKQYGGNLTEQDVEIAVNKYLAFGVLAIIEYVEPSEHNLII